MQEETRTREDLQEFLNLAIVDQQWTYVREVTYRVEGIEDLFEVQIVHERDLEGAELARCLRQNPDKRFATSTARDYKDSGPGMNYEKASKKCRLAGQIMFDLFECEMGYVPSRRNS